MLATKEIMLDRGQGTATIIQVSVYHIFRKHSVSQVRMLQEPSQGQATYFMHTKKLHVTDASEQSSLLLDGQ